MSKTITGILIGLSAFSILAFGDVAIKAMTSYMDTLSVGLYMNLFTILFLIPLILFYGPRKAFHSQTLKLHIFRSSLMLGVYLCVIFTLENLSLASSYTIGFLMPFVLNIIAFFLLKEKISIHRWGAIFVAFIAVLIAMRPGIEPFNIGYLSAIGIVLLVSCAFMTVKYISKDDHWLTFIVYPMTIQTSIIAIIMMFQDIPLIQPIEDSALIWLILGGLAFTSGLSLMPQAIKRLDASLFGPLFYIALPWGIFWGYIIFNDHIDLWTLTGAVIIILSGFYLIHREKHENSQLL
ncbi:MAG: DMT family transporter [Pseudomonadota bacterium]